MKTVVFIHGYSGNKYDFSDFPESLKKEFNVINPTMSGHETDYHDLLNYNYNDFYQFYENIIKNLSGEISLIGYSLGAQIAFDLATKYPISKIILVCYPYKFKFPFNSFIPKFVNIFQKFTDKRRDKLEIEQRNFDPSFYTKVPIIGLDITKNVNKFLLQKISSISSQIFLIGFDNDKILSPKNVYELEKIWGNKVKDIYLIQNSIPNHNPFFSKFAHECEDKIYNFLKLEN